MNPPIAITGVGYCVPASIRNNQDPIFQWLYGHGYPENQGPFIGFDQRRVLPCPGTLAEPPTTVADLMIRAAREALNMAKMPPDKVDILLGWASVSEFITP